MKMGGRDTDVVLLDENGIRCDGRKVNETRKVTIKAGVLKNADGSVSQFIDGYLDHRKLVKLTGVDTPKEAVEYILKSLH